MRRLCASILVVALPAACGGDDSAPAPGRGVAQEGPGEQAGFERATPGPMQRPEHDTRPRLGPGKLPPTYEVEERVEPGTPAVEERDFAGELRTLAGDPRSCVPVDAVRDVPDEVRIELQAVVTQNGVVTRAEATGPGLPADALDCIRGRIEAGRFRAPVEAGPRTVRAVVEMRRVRPQANAPP